MDDQKDLMDFEDEIPADDMTITLKDEDGNEVEFDLCDSIEYEGNDYVVLLPKDEEELIILQVDDENSDDEEIVYIGVEDEDVLTAVYEIFKEHAGDEYDFEE